jgi:predicted metal-binding membrane protein
VAGASLAIAALAWVISAQRMNGMDGGPGTDPGALGFFLGVWVVMMAAMMLPAAAPMAMGYAERQREARPQEPAARSSATALFATGYLAVWGLLGIAAYAVIEAGRALDGGVLGWNRGGRWVAAGIILAACLYQLTPAKRACLARCRDARSLMISRPSGGLEAGLGAGIRHGVWCVGCCWALMAALFALGAMSLAWMALISVLIAAERLLPWRRLSAGSVAVVLLALGVGVAAAPSRVPMLTIPGSPAAMRTMRMGPAQMGPALMPPARMTPPRTAPAQMAPEHAAPTHPMRMTPNSDPRE